MTYPQAQSYLNSFINYELHSRYPYGSFKLKRIKKLLHLLDNPEDEFKSIHVAGSKGKGSTCAFIANILCRAGFKVGLYTSPHLVDVRERIVQLAADSSPSTERNVIPKADFASLIEKIKPRAEKLRDLELGKLSYFEVFTALAFLYFKEKKVDFAVLETGLGGRLDATNVVSALVSAITPISYEHTDILGNTLKKIALEKAAIIKSKRQKTKDTRQIVVTAPQRTTVLKIIRKRARCAGADLYEVGKDIKFKPKNASLNGQSFTVQGIFQRYHDLKIPLLGRHQIVDAAVALASVEALCTQGYNISEQAVREGLRKTYWPGRLQIIAQKPKIVIDAAHNQASAQALKEALKQFFRYRNLILVLGVSQDKDVKGILRELMPLAKEIVLTKTRNIRAMNPVIIKGFIKTNAIAVTLTDNLNQALKIARRKANQKDLILICGSIFLVGEVIKRYKSKGGHFPAS